VPVRVEKWDPAWGKLTEAAMRRRLEAEGYAVSRYHYPPGTCFPEHTHAIDKKDTVLKGRLKIGAAGQEFVLRAGDMIEIPAGTPHTAEVVGRETVVSLDATRSR
jgi:quercetin dioxygenase-like cupin family protein